MPRQPRHETEGVHHVYARGNNREGIFSQVPDCEDYLELLAKVVRRARWQLLAYCLMPNHVHLLVETTKPTLGQGMHRLHGAFAQRFNARHARTGHVFEDRYGAVRIEDDFHFLVATSYIAANPVVAGLSAAAEDWRWSSHAATLADGPPPHWLDVDRLLSYFAAWGGEPRRGYSECVEARLEARVEGRLEARLEARLDASGAAA